MRRGHPAMTVILFVVRAIPRHWLPNDRRTPLLENRKQEGTVDKRSIPVVVGHESGDCRPAVHHRAEHRLDAAENTAHEFRAGTENLVRRTIRLRSN